MLPTRKQAHVILEEAYHNNPGPWREHSIVVAKCAAIISHHCEELNEEKAYILGLLHDIGRREGVTYLAHVIDGYRYLMNLGYDEAARICITHSFAEKDIHSYIGLVDVPESDVHEITLLLDGYQYDDYDRLIQLCDSIALPEGPVKIEIRMNDVKQRYGAYPTSKWNKHMELKEYFEQKTGLDLDDLHID